VGEFASPPNRTNPSGRVNRTNQAAAQIEHPTCEAQRTQELARFQAVSLLTTPRFVPPSGCCSLLLGAAADSHHTMRPIMLRHG
jgi:hypothetical protein